MIDINELLSLKQTLRFKKDGKFKILVLSDIHAGKGFSAKTTAGIEAIVADTKPDLVLFNGDTGGCDQNIHVETTDDVEDMLAELSAPMEKRGIAWAHVFGNHDDNFGLSHEEQEPVYESFPHCVSKAGPKELYGAGNYVLPVLASDGEKIVFNVFGLDTHNDLTDFCKYYDLPSDINAVLPNYTYLGRNYDTVHFNQVMWYMQASEALEKHNGAKIPALMYFHIPIPEFCQIVNNKEECSYEGNQREDIGCGELNPGLFSACLQRGDVKAIVAGHDHVNDFTGIYCGIMLAYDAALSYDGYQDDDLRGGRVFEIDENEPENFKTYMVRLADIMGKSANKNED